MADDILTAKFAAHADESLQIANATFEATAETWLRECVFPECLSPEEGRSLAEEIEYEDIHGEPQPNRELVNHRLVHGCVDRGSHSGPEDEPPW